MSTLSGVWLDPVIRIGGRCGCELDIALGDNAALRACTKSCAGDLDYCVDELVTEDKSKETLIVDLNDHCVFELKSCLHTCVN